MVLTRRWIFVCLFWTGATDTAFAQDELVDLIIGLLKDRDKEVRALAYEQVRTEAKGEAATRKFAKFMRGAPPDTQVGLLRALADRGDRAASSAVRELFTSDQAQVRVAVIRALGKLGETADLPLMTKTLAAESPEEREAARRSLIVLAGEPISSGLAASMKRAPPPVRVVIMEILATRRAQVAVPELLKAAVDDDSSVRRGAMQALGQLARTEHIGAMAMAVLKATDGPERAAAEKAVMFVCSRSNKTKDRSTPLLAAMESLDKTERAVLMSTLGRVGGPQARAEIERWMADADAKNREVGLRALCHWPDASISFRLLELARTAPDARHRRMALQALIRVAVLKDGRSDQRLLDFLRTAMVMCENKELQKRVLDRVKAVRTIHALQFVQPYVRDRVLGQQACLTVVELAHHSGLREAHRQAFHQVLDDVLEVSQDATVRDRAQRYKKGQTWVRPKVGS